MESSDESIEVVKDRYGYRMKPCSICGRKYGKRWANHWKVNHPGRVKTELKDGRAPENPAFDIVDKRFKDGIRSGSGKSHFIATREAFLAAEEMPPQISDQFPAVFYDSCLDTPS